MVHHGDQYHGLGLHMRSHDFHGVHMVKHNTPWVSLCEQWGTMVSYGIPWCPVGTPWDISVRVESVKLVQWFCERLDFKHILEHRKLIFVRRFWIQKIRCYNAASCITPNHKMFTGCVLRTVLILTCVLLSILSVLSTMTSIELFLAFV